MMALAPFRMATSERYEHCIVHTVFEHYIVTRCLLYVIFYLSNIDVVDCILCVNIDRA